MTTPFVTSSHIAPRVTVYSYGYDKPLNVTPWCKAVQVQASLSGSIDEQAVFKMVRSEAAHWMSVGDWVQIDLVDDTGHEHLFFGRVADIAHSNRVLGHGGGFGAETTVTCVTWAQVWRDYRKELRSAFAIYARKMAGRATTGEAPQFKMPLLGFIVASVEGGLITTPDVAVALVMQFLARYGGDLLQTFDLPGSLFSDGKSRPLHHMITRLNRRRLSESPSPMKVVVAQVGIDDFATVFAAELKNPSGTASDGSYLLDPDELNVARIVASATGNPDWKDSAWGLSDWHQTFKAHRDAYVPGNSLLEESLQFYSEANCWSVMMDLADPSWLQMHCGLVEHIDHPVAKARLTAHDGTPVERDFLLTVSLHLHPHPTYHPKPKSKLMAQKDKAGNTVVPANRSGYEKLCPKFVLDSRAILSDTLSTSLSDVFTMWTIKPSKVKVKGGRFLDHTVIGSMTNWQVPIIDSSIRAYGLRPLETETRFWLDKERHGQPAVLIRKALLQYAWTIRGNDHLKGALSTKMFDKNVPRPGDVGYIYGGVHAAHVSVGPDGNPIRDLGLTATPNRFVLDGHGDQSREMLSVYVEAVTVTMVLNGHNSVWGNTIWMQVSHGQAVGGGAHPKGLDESTVYRRGYDYSELGIDPLYLLPIRDIDPGQILSELDDVDDTPMLKELTVAAKKSPKKPRRRARRRAVVRPKVEAPIGMTMAPIRKTASKPPDSGPVDALDLPDFIDPSVPTWEQLQAHEDAPAPQEQDPKPAPQKSGFDHQQMFGLGYSSSE